MPILAAATIPIRFSRTYVFATKRTAGGVMDALRAGRTVVYDRDRAYGDPALIVLAQAGGALPRNVPELPVSGWIPTFSRIGSLGAFAVLLLFNRWNNAR